MVATTMLFQNRELQSNELRVRQQALLLLADVLHKRENLATAIREGEQCVSKYDAASYKVCAGLAGTLKDLLDDEDALVRERAAKVLCNMAREEI